MMEIFTLRARAAIQIAIDDYGTDTEKDTWQRWAAANPQVRKEANDPVDDGTGPIAPELYDSIISSLRRRYEHLRRQGRSPCVTRDEMVDLSNKMSYLYSIARRLSPVLQEWPSSL